jgi:hypothetical protein
MSDPLDALLAQVEALDLDDQLIAGIVDTPVGPQPVFRSSTDWETWADRHITATWAKLGIANDRR